MTALCKLCQVLVTASDLPATIGGKVVEPNALLAQVASQHMLEAHRDVVVRIQLLQALVAGLAAQTQFECSESIWQSSFRLGQASAAALLAEFKIGLKVTEEVELCQPSQPSQPN